MHSGRAADELFPFADSRGAEYRDLLYMRRIRREASAAGWEAKRLIEEDVMNPVTESGKTTKGWPLRKLLQRGAPIVYRGRQLDEIAMPVGGIGTGSISFGGWGQLRDFEIFNKPDKGLELQYTFFTLYARQAGHEPITRVLQGPVGGNEFMGPNRGNAYHSYGFGMNRLSGAGLPHFRQGEFIGMFPFGRVDLRDEKMPVAASVEAWNPFIPRNADDSGLPAALFNIELRNTTPDPVDVTLIANLENRIGHPEPGGGTIEVFEEPGVRGLSMTTRRHKPGSPRYGTMALATPHKDVSYQTAWTRGGWFDAFHRFWDHATQGRLQENREPTVREPDDRGTDIGSIALHARIAPGTSIRLPVWIIWHNPVFEMNWAQRCECGPGGDCTPYPIWRNYYATVHRDALAVARYLGEHHVRLERETRAFAEALYGSTLPAAVMDAVGSQISILKSTTCIRLEDGTFYGFEGCFPGMGCCEGTCTHVWNYAQALPFLFPALERSVREADFEHRLSEDGHMVFRMPLPLGTPPQATGHAAADGQMGGVLKFYREWVQTGDDDWLRRHWPSLVRSLEYAWRFWDQDKDGVMEGVQHNTYDIEFYGPNTMMGSLYHGALRAAEIMARHLGEHDKAREYRRLREQGRAWMDQHLFNGEYYIQEIRPDAPSSHERALLGWQGEDPDKPEIPRYQYGKGCLSDQLLGQWFARVVGLGQLFDPKHVKSALDSIFRYNWRETLVEHANPQRIYAVGDEAGLLLATWPHGERPGLPFVYSDEVWTGIEYQVAAHLIYEGRLREGLSIVKGLRDRFTGERRNPFNEFECGNHYARALASYSLLLALSDFQYSAPERRLAFAPRVYADDFACFFSIDPAWGMLRQRAAQRGGAAEVEVKDGRLVLAEIAVGLKADAAEVELAGRKVPAQAQAERKRLVLRFAEPVTIETGQTLRIVAG